MLILACGGLHALAYAMQSRESRIFISSQSRNATLSVALDSVQQSLANAARILARSAGYRLCSFDESRRARGEIG